MHKLSSSFVLGYHGCPRPTADALIAGTDFIPSQNDYDWLGGGIYFWLSDPDRALSFVSEKFRREGSDQEAAVVGAVIDLGLCLDLGTSGGVEQISRAYKGFEEVVRLSGDDMPVNVGGADLLKRHLDRAVIDYLHFVRDQTGVPPIDSVKSVFLEGDHVYPNAGFKTKTHIQIAVRNPECIKGVFRPR